MTSISDALLFVAERPILCLLGGFLIAFLLTRGVTCLIRAQRGPFADLSLGNLHLHHMVWGAGLVLASAEFALTPREPWNAASALAFGIGAALMLDEFALMIYLRDVYWTTEGRRSIDAVITMLVIVGMLTIPLAPGLLPSASLPIVALAALAYIALIAVCLLKGKMFTALAGVLVPVVLPIGAVRLARPGSPWAVIRYGGNPAKQQRAWARYRPTSPHERARQRVLAVLGGTLDLVSEGRDLRRSSSESAS
jgi:hypothetical protein